MSDIMGAGFYPHDPLPGPLEKAKPAWPLTAMPTGGGPYEGWVDANGDVWRRDHRDPSGVFWRIPTNPVLEPPMYFPGAGWQADAVYAG